MAYVTFNNSFLYSCSFGIERQFHFLVLQNYLFGIASKSFVEERRCVVQYFLSFSLLFPFFGQLGSL